MHAFATLAWLAFAAAPFLAWALFRSKGYKRAILVAPPTGGAWEDTGERFHDPHSGTVVAVWHDRETGERAYVRHP